MPLIFWPGISPKTYFLLQMLKLLEKLYIFHIYSFSPFMKRAPRFSIAQTQEQPHIYSELLQRDAMFVCVSVQTNVSLWSNGSVTSNKHICALCFLYIQLSSHSFIGCSLEKSFCCSAPINMADSELLSSVTWGDVRLSDRGQRLRSDWSSSSGLVLFCFVLFFFPRNVYFCLNVTCLWSIVWVEHVECVTHV